MPDPMSKSEREKLVVVELTRGEIISLLKPEDARPTTLNEQLTRSAKAKLRAAIQPATDQPKDGE